MEEPVLCIELHKPALKGLCCASGIVLVSVLHLQYGVRKLSPPPPLLLVPLEIFWAMNLSSRVSWTKLPGIGTNTHGISGQAC